MSIKPHILLLAIGCTLMFSACRKSAQEQVAAWYEQGKAMREQGEPAEAMAVLLKAAHSGTDNEGLLGRVYSNMANICRQANEHELAYQVYMLSAEHFAASKDELAYAYALNNMAWERAVIGYKDSALALIREAVMIYPLNPLTDKVIETHAAACLFAEEYDSVLYYTLPPSNDYLMMLRAQAYSYLQVNDSATWYAQTLLTRTDDPFFLDDLYYILTHNDTTADAQTIRDLSSDRADVQKAIEHRYGKLMQAVQLLRDDLSSRPTDWKAVLELGLIGLLCLAAVVMGIMTIIERRRLFRSWQEREHARQEDYEQSIRILSESDDLKQELQWNDYQAFCHQTDKLFHGLANTLQNEGLNEQDVRMCVLVLIGLSHKEIASMLPCSVKSIGKLKDLTARKLGVPGGKLKERLTALIIR